MVALWLNSINSQKRARGFGWLVVGGRVGVCVRACVCEFARTGVDVCVERWLFEIRLSPIKQLYSLENWLCYTDSQSQRECSSLPRTREHGVYHEKVRMRVNSDYILLFIALLTSPRKCMKLKAVHCIAYLLNWHEKYSILYYNN